jgi:hypothetical protein
MQSGLVAADEDPERFHVAAQHARDDFGVRWFLGRLQV